MAYFVIDYNINHRNEPTEVWAKWAFEDEALWWEGGFNPSRLINYWENPSQRKALKKVFFIDEGLEELLELCSKNPSLANIIRWEEFELIPPIIRRESLSTLKHQIIKKGLIR